MTKDEVIKKLLDCARQSDDAIQSEEIVQNVFMPLFKAAVDKNNIDRAFELKDYAERGRNIKRLQGEAELFREAAWWLMELMELER